MIPGSAVYHVVEAMAPLCTAAVLGYASVRWLKAFSDEQCAGINHFVALYAVPVLIFHVVYTNDPYAMNGRLIAADTLQKAAIILALMAWAICWSRRRRRRGGQPETTTSPVKWVVTNFSTATLTNTLIIGVPLLNGMYGAMSRGLVAQIVVVQFCFWYNVVIFLYQYMAAQDAGSAKISPESRVAEATAVEDAVRDDEDDGGDVAGERSRRDDDVALDIEITETEVSMARGNIAGEMTIVSKEAAEVTVVPEAAAEAPSVLRVIGMAGKKLLKTPNTYACFLGLVWSLFSFKFGIKMPKIVDDSLLTIYTTATGLSMFASGTFIARQPRFVPCGYTIASFSMVLKFLVGPVVMLLTSLAVGLRGTILHIAVVQSALPLAVTSFVYAEEYKVHPKIMSTGVIVGMFISLPVTIAYYILLAL
ncbi:hypothetical protein ACP4OV_018123 [Aristida adscensionis]